MSHIFIYAIYQFYLKKNKNEIIFLHVIFSVSEYHQHHGVPGEARPIIFRDTNRDYLRFVAAKPPRRQQRSVFRELGRRIFRMPSERVGRVSADL